MTDAEAEALGRRLVACRHFRPMRGMRDLQGRTWTPDLLWRWTPGVDVPDLRDPATLGCVLALVREAWNSPHLSCRPWRSGLEFVWCEDGISGPEGWWATEAEALVAALEAAP